MVTPPGCLNTPPCSNSGRARGNGPRAAASFQHVSNARRPSATKMRARGRASISAMSGDSSWRISAGVGLLSGGAQRTAARNPHILQHEAVVAVAREGLIGEAGGVERCHQEVAGAARAVAREDAARSVGAVRGGRESDEDDARTRIAEARNGPAPVRVIPIGRALLGGDPRCSTCGGARNARRRRWRRRPRRGGAAAAVQDDAGGHASVLMPGTRPRSRAKRRLGLLVRVIRRTDERTRLHVTESQVEGDALELAELVRRVVPRPSAGGRASAAGTGRSSESGSRRCGDRAAPPRSRPWSRRDPPSVRSSSGCPAPMRARALEHFERAR